MLNVGPQELLVILVIALVVVGPRRLPELSRAIGKALRSLRSAQDEVRRTVQEVLDPEPVREATRDLRAARDEVRGAFRPGSGPAHQEPDAPSAGGEAP